MVLVAEWVLSETERSEQDVGLALSQNPELKGSELAQSLRAGFALHPAPCLWQFIHKPRPADLFLLLFSQL